METAEKICDTILATRGEFKEAQDIGITVLNKFGIVKEEEIMITKLRELAFYVQTLARGYQSQLYRAELRYKGGRP